MPFLKYTILPSKIPMRLLISCFMILLCSHSVLSIKCWVCRSDSDPKCADPFDNSTVPITDCKQEPYLPHLPGIRPEMCRKTRQKIFGQWRYFRSCAYLGEPGIHGDERFCLMRTGTYNIFSEYCTCVSKDGCNSGSLKSYLQPITMIIIAIATLMFIPVCLASVKI